MEKKQPGIIQKLDEAVVNRIAAGEIIQRPMNALKELIENSLDAKSSVIQITVKSGGLKYLQIADNGTGIRREDLNIVCERFTTSKLKQFEDLTCIATFGFRGEALASISHVAHLTIQTKTAQDQCGYKATYLNGKPKAPAKPCAMGTQGTTITIEDLFYNMPQRQQALKSPAEEYQKISDVVSKYAVHNASVAFTLKKFGETPSLKTSINSTRQANIACIFGGQIAKDLITLELHDDVHQFQLYGLATKVNYSAKKSNILLFINHRSVESPAIKTAIDGVYSTYLAKGMHPFIYMSLEMVPNNLDVNVHPTKHEVHFLYEDEIVEKIKAHLEAQLLGSNETRTFYKQLKLPGIEESSDDAGDNAAGSSQERIQAKDMIRTDSKEQKLDKFLSSADRSGMMGNGFSPTTRCTSTTASPKSGSSGNESFRVIAARKSKEVRLTSVLTMQKRVENGCNVALRKAVKEMVFVGVVDRTFALFQHETKLCLCNTIKFSEELFYQRLVYEFQNMPQIKVSPALSVKQLILIALNSSESGWTPDDGDKHQLAESASAILVEKAVIMSEYFALRISAAGELESLPALLANHCPSNTFLPIYMLRLATEVEWETEAECFESFCRETARFYAQQPAHQIESHPKRHKWLVEHVLYPAFKQFLLPPNALQSSLYELTQLPKLYKVFERC